MKEYVNKTLDVKLVGGPLDGDEFDMAPNGSQLPPMRLSYMHKLTISDGERACWLNYEHKNGIVHWTQGSAIYEFAGIDMI